MLKRTAVWILRWLRRLAPPRARGLGGWTTSADDEGNVQIVPGGER